MPPFEGPRAMLCVTRYPSNAWIDPSSIVTGTETTTAFLHSWSTLTRFESTANCSATRRSCSFAIAYGFSRRWDTGTSIAVTDAPWRQDRLKSRRKWRPKYRPSPDRELHRPDRRAAPVRRHRGQSQRVVAGREQVPLRVAACEPEGVAARQQVAHPHEQSE